MNREERLSRRRELYRLRRERETTEEREERLARQRQYISKAVYKNSMHCCYVGLIYIRNDYVVS